MAITVKYLEDLGVEKEVAEKEARKSKPRKAKEKQLK